MPEERKRQDELSIKVVQLSQNAITSFFVKEKRNASKRAVQNWP